MNRYTWEEMQEIFKLAAAVLQSDPGMDPRAVTLRAFQVHDEMIAEFAKREIKANADALAEKQREKEAMQQAEREDLRVRVQHLLASPVDLNATTYALRQQRNEMNEVIREFHLKEWLSELYKAVTLRWELVNNELQARKGKKP